jgi:predicted XRE-type DNA-binding protein
MPTRPTQPDPSGKTPTDAFAGLGAGLGFFQDWMKAAASALPNMGGATSAGAPSWSLPTLDPEELDKRIKDLKTVKFWLEQNAQMIAMTIQTLEVQRMTLSTLQELKVPVDALKDALKAQANPAPAGPTGQTEATAPGVNPMAWWGTLTEQFSTLASQAVAAGQEAMEAAAAAAPQAASPAGKAASPKPKSARKAAPRAKASAAASAAGKASRR